MWKMDIVFTATDMGFKVREGSGPDPGKELSDASRVQIDGLEFPKDLPQPVFGTNSCAQYTRVR